MIRKHDTQDDEDATSIRDGDLAEYPIKHDTDGETVHYGDHTLSGTVSKGDNEHVNSNCDEQNFVRNSEADERDDQSDTSDFRFLDDLEMDRGFDAVAAAKFLVDQKQRDPIDLDIDTAGRQIGVFLACFELLQLGDGQQSSKSGFLVITNEIALQGYLAENSIDLALDRYLRDQDQKGDTGEFK
ncbi:MAG: hypothetical protein Q9192_007390 [Flavoplaca navasiana]